MMFILKRKKRRSGGETRAMERVPKIKRVVAEKRKTKKQERMGSNTCTFSIINHCDYQACVAVNR